MASRSLARRVDAYQRTRALAPDLDALRAECRSLVRRRAVMAAAVSFVPIPGVDFITDVAVLVNLLPEINARFGLTEAQVERLSPARKAIAYRLMVTAGGALARKITTTQLLGTVLRRAGLRLGVMEVTRLMPIIGQGVAAVIAYIALTHLANKHIDECAVLALEVHDAETP
jgi:uncharacterized protein (DUF697 family)